MLSNSDLIYLLDLSDLIHLIYLSDLINLSDTRYIWSDLSYLSIWSDVYIWSIYMIRSIWSDLSDMIHLVWSVQQALTNIRLSCCGGGSLIPVVKRHHHIETLEMLRELHAVGAVDLRRIDNFIYRATAGEISSCQVCSYVDPKRLDKGLRSVTCSFCFFRVLGIIRGLIYCL